VPTIDGKLTRAERKAYNRELAAKRKQAAIEAGRWRRPTIYWDRATDEELAELLADQPEDELLPEGERQRLRDERSRFLAEIVERRAARVRVEPIRRAPSVAGVYFVRAHDRVKIGVASNVAHRLMQLRTGSPFPLHLMAVQEGAGREHEQDLHRRFGHLHVVGEWFQLKPELLEYIATVRGLMV
jgi:hypothetical protein